MYLVTGNVTYSTTANRTTAYNAMVSVIASYPSVVGTASALPAGVNTSGTLVVTLSVSVPDDVIEQFRTDMRVAWTSAARSAVQMGAAKT